MVNDLVLQKLGEHEDFRIKCINRAFPVFNEAIGEFSIKKVIFYVKQYIQALKVLKSDIVYVAIGLTFFGVLKDAPFILLGKLFRKQIVIHVHGGYLKTQYKSLKGIKKKIFRYILSLGDKGIVSSQLLKDNLTPFMSDNKIFWIPYFVERALENITEKDVVNTEELKILYLSNLMKGKGVFDVLEALEILNEKGVDYKARFVGGIDGENKGEIMANLNNNPNIQYFKPIRGKAKTDIYLWANVFVLPTYYSMEGQPIALLEAMMAGNIIVTTDHAGIMDICSEKNGYIVEKKSPKEIAEKLEIISQGLVKLKKIMVHNHHYAKNNFKPENFINSLTKILIE